MSLYKARREQAAAKLDHHKVAALLETIEKKEGEITELKRRLSFWELAKKYYPPLVFGLSIIVFALGFFYLEIGAQWVIGLVLAQGINKSYLFGALSVAIFIYCLQMSDLVRIYGTYEEYLIENAIFDEEEEYQAAHLAWEEKAPDIEKRVIKAIEEKQNREKNKVLQVSELGKYFVEDKEEGMLLKDIREKLEALGITVTGKKISKVLYSLGYQSKKTRMGIHYFVAFSEKQEVNENAQKTSPNEKGPTPPKARKKVIDLDTENPKTLN